jgi:transposase
MKIIHWIGIDDHADKWTIAHFKGSEEKPAREFELAPGGDGYRKLIKYCKELGGEVRIVYEAGPCGYELYRRLTKAGLTCDVAAPSLTPRKPGERVKTNRRDAAKLGRYLRAGDMLTLIEVPDQGRESLRDLVRARHAVQKDLLSVRHRITKLVLRYGHRYDKKKTAWTNQFWTWLGQIKLEGEHSQFVLTELITAHEHRLKQRGRYDDEIEAAAKTPQYARFVAALSVLRGIDRLSAMTILSELGDLRRFATAPQLMAAIGLVPRESSTGDTTNRLSITKTGNAHVRHIAVEAAWQYERRISNGRVIKGRRKDQPKELLDIAEKCDLRLNRKFHRMTSRGKRSTVAAVAVARELMGFIWAIGQIVHP